MRKITLAFLLCFCFVPNAILKAQFKVIAKSPGFEEPEKGNAKIILMKNGNTAFLNITVKDGIFIKMYSPEHKVLFTRTLQHKFAKLKGLSVEACLETKNNITMLLSEYDDRTPTLHRIVISGNEGKIVSQETLATLKKLKIWDGYSVAFGGVPLPDFVVRRDPNSENYAVACFNSFASESDQRFELIHYNNMNEEISRSYLSSPEGQYKYIEIVDIAVMGDKEAIALLNGYNTRSSGGKETELLMAHFSKNEKQVKYESLLYEEELRAMGAIMKVNPRTQKIHVLLQATVTPGSRDANGKKLRGNTTYYALRHFIHDPVTSTTTDGPDVEWGAINDAYKGLFGEKKNYSGVLQNMYMEDDGGYSIVLEGLEIITTQRGSSSSTEYVLGDLAVMRYSASGSLSQTLLVPKEHSLNSSILTGGAGASAYPLYHYKRDFTAQALGGGNQYKSFAYLSGKDKSYVLMNDIERNQESMQKGKITKIRGLDECDGFYFPIGENTTQPRQFIFGKPDGKKDHNLGLFTISDYDRERNMYATLVLERDGRDKSVRVVWLTPN